MRVIGSNVLVRKLPPERTASGLILPEMGSTLFCGKVISTGGKVQTVQVGDTVGWRQQTTTIGLEGNILILETQLVTVNGNTAN